METPSKCQLNADLYVETAEALDAKIAARDALAKFVAGTVEFLTGEEQQVPLA